MKLNQIDASLKVSICLLHECSACCNPVKIDYRKFICAEADLLPFIDRGEMLVPERNTDSIRLRSYNCMYLDQETGLCSDYFNRPAICRNTSCLAFYTADRKKQAEIIENIRTEKFLRISTNKHVANKGGSKCAII